MSITPTWAKGKPFKYSSEGPVQEDEPMDISDSDTPEAMAAQPNERPAPPPPPAPRRQSCRNQEELQDVDDASHDHPSTSQGTIRTRIPTASPHLARSPKNV